MPKPNTIVAVSFSKSSLPKFDYYLSQWVSKYQNQYDIYYFPDIWGPEFRQHVEDIDPILMVHNGHGYSEAWLCQFPDSWPIEEYTAMNTQDWPLMVGRIGISHSCYAAGSIGIRWGIEGIAYFGYEDISYTINPFEEYNYPYRDDWYWMENGINDYFCQGHTLGESFALQLDEFDRLIDKWSTERPNEYWTRYVGYAQEMKARAKLSGDPSIRLTQPIDWKKWLTILGISMGVVGLGLIYQKQTS